MPDILLPGYPRNLRAIQVTIASGLSASEMIATQGDALVGIFIPSNGWTAAAIGYKTCFTGNPNDLVNAYDNGGNLEQTAVNTALAAAAGFIAIPQSDTLFVPFIQLTSVTAGSASGVAQAADRVMTLLLRHYLD